MRFWIDTEFNGHGGALISMALVTDDGHEWYEVLACDNPVVWVAENVMPRLARKPISRPEMQQSLACFLASYPSVHVVADWPEDIQHCCALLISGPGMRISTPPLTLEIRRDLDSEESLVPHNALADARAIRAMGLT